MMKGKETQGRCRGSSVIGRLVIGHWSLEIRVLWWIPQTHSWRCSCPKWGPPENAGRDAGHLQWLSQWRELGEETSEMLDLSEAKRVLPHSWINIGLFSLEPSFPSQDLLNFRRGKFIARKVSRKEEIQGPILSLWLQSPHDTVWRKTISYLFAKRDVLMPTAPLRALTLPKHRLPPDRATSTGQWRSGLLKVTLRKKFQSPDRIVRKIPKDDIWWRPESGAEASHEGNTADED